MVAFEHVETGDRLGQSGRATQSVDTALCHAEFMPDQIVCDMAGQPQRHVGLLARALLHRTG